MPRVLIKASLMVKVLLHLPFSHLPPTPHLLAVHKISLPISFNSHHFPRCQPGHIVRLAVGILFLPPPLIWSSLSHLYIPSQFVTVFPFSSFFVHDVLSSPRIPLPPVTLSRLPLYTNTTPLKLLPSPTTPTSPYLSSWPAWAYCPARRSYFFLPPFLFVLLSLLALTSPSTFSLSSRLSPPLLLSSAPIVSQGVCPRWLGPTWQHLL